MRTRGTDVRALVRTCVGGVLPAHHRPLIAGGLGVGAGRDHVLVDEQAGASVEDPDAMADASRSDRFPFPSVYELRLRRAASPHLMDRRLHVTTAHRRGVVVVRTQLPRRDRPPGHVEAAAASREGGD